MGPCEATCPYCGVRGDWGAVNERYICQACGSESRWVGYEAMMEMVAETSEQSRAGADDSRVPPDQIGDEDWGAVNRAMNRLLHHPELPDGQRAEAA